MAFFSPSACFKLRWRAFCPKEELGNVSMLRGTIRGEEPSCSEQYRKRGIGPLCADAGAELERRDGGGAWPPLWQSCGSVWEVCTSAFLPAFLHPSINLSFSPLFELGNFHFPLRQSPFNVLSGS